MGDERIHLTLVLARKSDYEWLRELQLASNFVGDKLTFSLDKATTTRLDERKRHFIIERLHRRIKI
jgi:hypothetical protein